MSARTHSHWKLPNACERLKRKVIYKRNTSKASHRRAKPPLPMFPAGRARARIPCPWATYTAHAALDRGRLSAWFLGPLVLNVFTSFPGCKVSPPTLFPVRPHPMPRLVNHPDVWLGNSRSLCSQRERWTADARSLLFDYEVSRALERAVAYKQTNERYKKKTQIHTHIHR